MAIELATAYVSIVASTADLKKSIEDVVGPASTPSKKAGEGIGSKLLDGIGKTLKVGALAVGTAAAAGIGTALVKGFQRLDALDQATAKLSGLGHSAETVEKIMGNALDSVRGTAFGMGEAATSAAGAVAAGIKPGADLARNLKLVADASTIAGTDMGSMGAIFNKVAASNKVQMDVINQLHDAGVPALALLAEQMGVTAEEASKMASKGEVDFATFSAAMESGLGGAALKSGETFSGALDNMLASLGRIGANLLEGFFPQVKDGFLGLTAGLSSFEGTAKVVGASIASFVSTTLPSMVQGFNDVYSGIKNMVDFVKANSTWLGPLTAAILGAAAAITIWRTAMSVWAIAAGVTTALSYGMAGATYATGTAATIVTGITKAWAAAQWLINAAMTANPIGIVVVAIAALVAGLAYFFTQTELGQQIWANFTAGLAAAWNWLWENALKPVFEAIGAYFTWLWSSIIKPIIGIIISYVNLWAAIFTWLWQNVLSPIFAAMGAIFEWLWGNIIKPIIDSIVAYVKLLASIFGWLWKNAIKPVIDLISTGIGMVGDVVGKIFGAIGNAIRGAFEGAVGFVKGVMNSLIGVINGAINGINTLIRTVNKVPGVSFPTLGNIPQLANGGIISKSRGGSIVNVGEGRYDEAVVPLGGPQFAALAEALNSQGVGGDQHGFNNYGTIQVTDEKALVEEIAKQQRRASAVAGIRKVAVA